MNQKNSDIIWWEKKKTFVYLLLLSTVQEDLKWQFNKYQGGRWKKG